MGIASTSDYDTLSSFSNYGNIDVWIAAPGEYVISTFPGGTFAASSGTSFSSPLVAGSADLLMSVQPNGLRQASAANALAHAVKLTPNLNNGRLDVYQALSAWINAN
jgi:subtilisin family serine protease